MDADLTKTLGDASVYAGKTLAQRLTGRFYTPDIIGSDLAEHVADALEASGHIHRGTTLKVCDPFAGDGRLLVAFLIVIARRTKLRGLSWAFTVRDIDKSATGIAARELTEIASSVGVRARICVLVGDSFHPPHPEQHHVVITNPPWELLKPDAREQSFLSHREALDYRQNLKALSAKLDAQFPDTKAERSWGAWGTNLARCGWEIALRSCVPRGVVGIVLPTTILGDQASSGMRRSVLDRATLRDLSSYPPEARLFTKVDQPVVAATFVLEPSDGKVDAQIRQFGADRSPSRVSKLTISHSELAAQNYILPVGFGIGTGSILARIPTFPRGKDLEGEAPNGLWPGRELDETRLSGKLTSGKRYPFIKGCMIKRHEFIEHPSSSVRANLVNRLRSIRFERLVWRDVARPSQRRRMIATLIPPTWIAGNSLHVAYFRDAHPLRLRALYAIASSFVFVMQIRSRLATR